MGTYHGTGVVRPDLVPVGSDGGAGFDARGGQLESTGGAVVVAREGRVGCILDRVATHTRGVSDRSAKQKYV